MAWYVARSLDVLLGQLNAKAPNRSKVSDGSIGDAAHSARESDHNPTASGQVCARDFTNDPAGGLAGQWLADALVASRDPRIKYVIFNHRILDTRPGFKPWTWQPYFGQNAHEHHVHVSVFAGALGDSTAPWNLGAATATPQENDMQLSDKVNMWSGAAKPQYTVEECLASSVGWAEELGKRLTAMNIGLLAAIEAATQSPDITKESMAEIVDSAIARHIQITGEVHIGPAGQ